MRWERRAKKVAARKRQMPVHGRGLLSALQGERGARAKARKPQRRSG